MGNHRAYRHYWAKVDKADPTRYHLYPYHCLDVMAVAEAWLDTSAVLLEQASRSTQMSHEETKRLLLFFVMLHDLGKLDARFQSKVETVREVLQGDAYWIEPEPYDHGSYGYHHFVREVGDSKLMHAVAGHHGSVNMATNYFLPEADDELIALDIKARKEWVQTCLEFVGLDAVPLTTHVIPMLAGLCSISDWIGSSLTNFITDPELDLHGYYEDAKKRAGVALIETGMLPTIGKSGFEGLFPGFTPRGIQKVIDDIPIQPGLTLVEGETGSGKTEFALAYASKLIAANHADGIVFGLPTQATANGLFDRIGTASKTLFPDGDVTLAHGKRKFYIPDANGFLHQSTKRAFLGGMSVATVDQVLMGVLPVKHNFVRTFGTRKSVLILDEVHSFDAYMTGLVTQVLKGQHASFSSVILLSATLPGSQKKQLLSPYVDTVKTVGQETYPLVTWAGLNGDTVKLETDEKIPPKTVQVTCWESESLLPSTAHLEKMAEWVNKGAMVCLICNTVYDAQKTYKEFIASYPALDTTLFHARYTVADRTRKEKYVLQKFGKHAKRDGCLLIATQVVEQSLDLDFDVMISQIAPIEFLIQRLGRLWRHDRINDNDLAPRTQSIQASQFYCLTPGTEGVNNYEKIYGASAYIYKDVRVLYRTQKILQENALLEFPTSYRSSIEYVHAGDEYNDEPESLLSLAEQRTLESEASFYNALKISSQYASPVSDADPRAALLTREGDMAIQVVLVDANTNPINGGVIHNPIDRELSTVSVSRKIAKGHQYKDEDFLIAEVGKDMFYESLGVIDPKKNW